MSYVALIGLLALTVLMLFDNSARPQVIAVGVFFAALVALSAVARRRNAAAVPAK